MAGLRTVGSPVREERTECGKAEGLCPEEDATVRGVMWVQEVEARVTTGEIPLDEGTLAK